MTNGRTITFTIAAVLALAACGGGIDEAADTEPVIVATDDAITTAPPSTETEPAATNASTTIELSTTTAEATTTTTEPPPVATGAGLVWESIVDPARVNATDVPTFEADGITATIDMVIAVDMDVPGDLVDECLNVDATDTCLMVQWRFDVAPEFRTDSNSDEGALSAGALITADGKQVDSVYMSSGFPGTVDNGLTEFFADGGPGSTLKFDTGSNLVGYTTHTYVVPPAEQLLPIYFD